MNNKITTINRLILQLKIFLFKKKNNIKFQLLTKGIPVKLIFRNHNVTIAVFHFFNNNYRFHEYRFTTKHKTFIKINRKKFNLVNRV